jgi:protein translocase SecG subunit
MLYGFLLTLFVINCFLLILLILIQQGKSSMGLGAMGGSTQMLFGGSGGQDIFQKMTWILGAIFMLGSFGLALHKTSASSAYLSSRTTRTATQQMPTSKPAQESAPVEPAAAEPASEPATEEAA